MAFVAGLIWKDRAQLVGTRVGAAAAWAASSASVAWLLWARGRSMKIFWWSFGGGMALRAATLGALVFWGLTHPGSSLEAVLLSYVFTLIATLLTLEIRHMRL